MPRMMGRYELIAPLARGGMAELFLARRRGPGGVEKRLVIKRVRRERAADARFLELFVSEARLSMSLAHRNIVTVFDFGRAGDELFLVMEHVDGCDLGAALRLSRERAAALDPQVCAFIAMEACEALDYAQRLGGDGDRARPLVHRDITPANVLLSVSGEVKLADFGIALREARTGDGALRGTPAYMSPEQARGDAVDVRSDVFSLGLVLYEALSGTRAYGGDGAREAIALARAGEVPPLSGDAPAALRAIVERATLADREQRFQTAREMQLALDRYLVIARSEAERKPPAMALAEWLREILDGRSAPPAAGESSQDDASGDAPVRTFLDDGVDGVVSLSATRSGTIPETVLETAVEQPAEPARRWAVWAVAAGGVIAAIAAVTFALSGDDDRQRDGGELAVAAAAPAADAAAGPATAPIDAGPAPLPVTADAAPARVDDAGATARVDPPPAREGDPVPVHRRRAPAPDAGVGVGVTAATGTVKVHCRPWAEVSVIGRSERCPDTPCTLTLPPGMHTLRLSNPVTRTSKTVQVDVASGETRYVKEALTAEE